MDPLQFAQVQLGPVDISVSVGGNSMFELHDLESGSYTMEVTKGGYLPWHANFTVEMSKTTFIDVYMDRIPEPEKIPIRCPLPSVRQLSTDLMPVATYSSILFLFSG